MSSTDFTHVPHARTGRRPILVTGALLLAAIAALVAAGEPAPTTPAPDAVFSAPSVIEDWRGNSAGFTPAQN